MDFAKTFTCIITVHAKKVLIHCAFEEPCCHLIFLLRQGLIFASPSPSSSKDRQQPVSRRACQPLINSSPPLFRSCLRLCHAISALVYQHASTVSQTDHDPCLWYTQTSNTDWGKAENRPAGCRTRSRQGSKLDYSYGVVCLPSARPRSNQSSPHPVCRCMKLRTHHHC